MSREKFAKIMKKTDKFNRLRTAERFMYRCEKPRTIILGDDGKYWVLHPNQAAKLNAAGYEYAVKS
jgi:hypothetical protein